MQLIKAKYITHVSNSVAVSKLKSLTVKLTREDFAWLYSKANMVESGAPDSMFDVLADIPLTYSGDPDGTLL